MTETVSIQKISQEEARRLLNSCDGIGGRYEPLGLFYLEEQGQFIGTDNSTGEEEDDILECFMDSFGRMFPSFSRVHGDQWIRDGAYGDVNRRVIMESKLFYVAVQDNEWSLAVELIQKEPPYDDHLGGLQARHYQRYLDGMKTCLLERLPSICIRTGPWTSERITREEASA